jgi:hypothetical protein
MDEFRDKVTAIRAMPEFSGSDWWLTFYLTAAQERLERVALHLRSLGAVNLDGAEGGFLYSKLPVQGEPNAVALIVSQVRALADADGVETLSVDVDTSPDVMRSNFVELARFSWARQ